MKKLTPAQQQYTDLKQQHNDCLLFFRLGDFYELFHDDAKIAHKVLGITLTARNKQAENPIPMAGIPYHALEKYVPQLIEAGHKIAIAEQVGKPVPGKVVAREVTQVITPGTYIGTNTSEQHIMAFTHAGGLHHLARGDFTLGVYTTKTVSSLDEALGVYSLVAPVEIVLENTFGEKDSLLKSSQNIHSGCVATQGSVPFDTKQFLCDQLQVSNLQGYGKALQDGRESSVALLFDYLVNTQKRSLHTLHSFKYDTGDDQIHLDEVTIKNLELFSSSYEGSIDQSLYEVMNTCSTAMGSRLLKHWIAFPSKDLTDIEIKSERIQYFMNETELAQSLQLQIKNTPDIPRLLTSLLYRKPSPRKVLTLRNILHGIFSDAQLVDHLKDQGGLENAHAAHLSELATYLQTIMKDEVNDEQKDFISDGVDPEIDKLRQIAYASDELLLKYQKTLVAKSGVKNVKIKYIKNQGYSLEVTPKDIDQFELCINSEDQQFDLHRAQSLKGGQRYTSSYLQELQTAILDAAEKLIEAEQKLLGEIIGRIKIHAQDLFDCSDAIARLDVSTSHAIRAVQQNWVRPHVSGDISLNVLDGRHPVVERYLSSIDHFIPNDLNLDKNDFFHLITGPNMGGKSTYLRQNAIIVLLAHAGCMVPASKADIPLVDGIFARVGSGDALAKNQSTFMTEMIEMSNILHHATSSSFIILDELGRGTSTYDGLALAKAITVYICQHIKSPCLFATHYHELTGLAGELEGFSNRHVQVKEDEKEVLFLKKIVSGGASKSYGLDVAKMSGIPAVVHNLAKKYLKDLESKDSLGVSHPQQSLRSGAELAPELDKDSEGAKLLQQLIKDLDLDEMTPVQLMQKIAEIQDSLDEKPFPRH